MHYTAISLDGLKILADTEKLYGSRIKSAVDRAVTFHPYIEA